MTGFRSPAPWSLLGTRARTIALALVVCAPTLAAQQPPAVLPVAARPDFTSASAEAKAAFGKALDDAAYLFNARAASELTQALAADSTFGLARALHAAMAPGLDQARRDAEATRAVADAARGSTGELLLAAAWREAIANHPANAQSLFRALADMYPSDALFALWAANDWAGTRSAAATVTAYQDLTRRFPNYGAAYNTLAYTLVATGDTAGALAAAKRQIDLAPDRPNAQDSYAELLQWSGRLDEAAAAYAEATRLAPTFTEGYVGLAEVRQLQRRPTEARAALGDALRNAQGIGDSLRYMTYLAQNAVYANDLPGAMRQLASVTQLAEQRKLNPQAAVAHANLAAVSALMNDRAAVARHGADAFRLLEARSGPQTPRTVVAAYITAGMTDTLRAFAARTDSAFIAKAAVALADGRAQEALQALTQADSTASMVQELSAEAHAKLGHADVARAARQRLLARRDLYYNDTDLRNALALRRASAAKM